MDRAGTVTALAAGVRCDLSNGITTIVGRASIRDFHGSPVFTISPFSVLSSVIIMVTSYKSFQGLLWPNLSLLPSQRPQLIILSLRPFLVFSSVYVEIGSHLFFIYNSFFFIFFTSSSPSPVLCV